jgi:hypothetical protein
MAKPSCRPRESLAVSFSATLKLIDLNHSSAALPQHLAVLTNHRSLLICGSAA